MDALQICQGMYNLRAILPRNIPTACSFVTHLLYAKPKMRRAAMNVLCRGEPGFVATWADMVVKSDYHIMQQFIRDRVVDLLTRDFDGHGDDLAVPSVPAVQIQKFVGAMCLRLYSTDVDFAGDVMCDWIAATVRRDTWPLLILVYALLRCGMLYPIICRLPSNDAWCVLDLTHASAASFADLTELFDYVHDDTDRLCTLLIHWSGWDGCDYVWVIDGDTVLHRFIVVHTDKRTRAMLCNSVCWLIRVCNYYEYDTMSHGARYRYVCDELGKLRCVYKGAWTGTWPAMESNEMFLSVLRACAKVMTRDAKDWPIRIEVDTAYQPRYVRVHGGRIAHNAVYRYDFTDDDAGGYGIVTDGVAERETTPVMDLPEDTVLMVIRDHVSALVSKRRKTCVILQAPIVTLDGSGQHTATSATADGAINAAAATGDDDGAGDDSPRLLGSAKGTLE